MARHSNRTPKRKQCPACRWVNAYEDIRCVACSYNFPEHEPPATIASQAMKEGPLPQSDWSSPAADDPFGDLPKWSASTDVRAASNTAPAAAAGHVAPGPAQTPGYAPVPQHIPPPPQPGSGAPAEWPAQTAGLSTGNAAWSGQAPTWPTQGPSQVAPSPGADMAEWHSNSWGYAPQPESSRTPVLVVVAVVIAVLTAGVGSFVLLGDDTDDPSESTTAAGDYSGSVAQATEIDITAWPSWTSPDLRMSGRAPYAMFDFQPLMEAAGASASGAGDIFPGATGAPALLLMAYIDASGAQLLGPGTPFEQVEASLIAMQKPSTMEGSAYVVSAIPVAALPGELQDAPAADLLEYLVTGDRDGSLDSDGNGVSRAWIETGMGGMVDVSGVVRTADLVLVAGAFGQIDTTVAQAFLDSIAVS